MSLRTFRLPDLGEGLTGAEIVRWLVAEGEDVAIDQPVVEVETAKAAVEVPTPFAGRVAQRHAEEGENIDVGAPLISVEVADESSVEVPDPAAAEVSDEGSGSVLVGYGTTARPGLGRRHRPRTPAERAALGAVADPLSRPNERRIPLNGFRRAAAAAFTRSRAEIPEVTIWVDVDATPLIELRESGRTPEHPGPGLLAYVARLAVAALAEYPVFNARFDAARQEIVETSDINLGVAVQGERGLVVPTIMAAQSMSVAELDEEIDRAVDRARQGRVTATELAAGTFTLNNYGPLRVDGSTAIINYPQVAILGIGRIVDRPWVVGGALAIRKITQLSFVFDHRVCDGATAAAFVRYVADGIEAARVESTVEVADGRPA
jgi:pyruvate dehydrogenase E2 component (dihydrolipoamide acetyltransferase)